MSQRPNGVSISKRRAMLARAEQVIDWLRDLYINEGWDLDEKGAEDTLRYLRRWAGGGRETSRENRAADIFFMHHGQSLDWIYSGDIGGMVARCAKHSERMEWLKKERAEGRLIGTGRPALLTVAA